MQEEIEFTTKHFQDLSASELYDILCLRSEIFVVEQTCIYNDMDNKDQKCLHLMGFANKQIVVYARLVPEGISYEKYSSIGRVIVHPDYRGQQLGYLLMNKAIQETKKHCTAPIKISAQAHLEGFYSNLGFATTTDKPYLEDGIPHLAMILT